MLTAVGFQINHFPYKQSQSNTPSEVSIEIIALSETDGYFGCHSVNPVIIAEEIPMYTT
jgi:hypothetical protein